MFPAVRTFQHSGRIGLVIFAFRVYRRHGAIVARGSDAVPASFDVFGYIGADFVNELT
jgi:hypothetical protein